jgi:hypothetical protein
MLPFNKIVEVKDHITSDKLSKYEIARIISCRIDDVVKGSPINLTAEEMLIPVDDMRISSEKIVTYKGKNYIKITDTTDLVKRELNMNKCPYIIERLVGEKEGIKYVEYRNPNLMIKPML